MKIALLLNAKFSRKFKSVALLQTTLFLAFYFFTHNVVSYQKDIKILVLYPKVKAEYQVIFSSMIQGIKNKSGIPVGSFEVDANTTAETVDSWIRANNGKALITLGKQSFNISTQLTTRIPTITGATVAPQNKHSGISLMGEPKQFFSYIKSLNPMVSHVHIVYSKKNSGWLIPHITSAGIEHQIKVTTAIADDPQQAVLAFQNILVNAKGSVDALWLLMDRVIPDNAILPSILETAWKEKLIVFSSNPGHVQRGILFALYPDYEQMGHELAMLAIKTQSHQGANNIYPTKSLNAAINTRTASHLGLHPTPHTLQRFNKIFPTP